MLLSLNVFSQSLKKNSIYLEAGGNAIVYSVNYDRIIPLSTKLKLAPRIGFEYFPHSTRSAYNDFVIPLEANILFGKTEISKNFAEAGVGLTLVGMKDYYLDNGELATKNTKNKFARITLMRLGFRHQKPIGGLMYRAGLLVPIDQYVFSKGIVGDDIFSRLYAGLSLGYAF